ncbi:hypothetical protein P7C70_g687, partial [Phenoliferia sp. Uapishka_3]
MESPVAEPTSITPTPPADEEMAPAATETAGPSNSPPPPAKADSSPPPAASPVRVEPVIDIEAEAAKKRRQAILQDENKKRGKRMFGLLQNTLKQAKKETGKLSGATKNRQEVEERLHAKLNGERTEMEEKRKRDRETKELRLDVLKKEEEISTAESIYRTRNAAKMNLASFLCTTFTLPPPPPASDGITVPYAPRLPHALRVTNPTASRPLYYLPYRLLPFQEDKIEDQVAMVKKNIRIEREKWEDLREDKVSDLTAAKRKRDAGLEEIERAEREDRQKRRREEEEREERVKSKPRLDGPGAMEVDGEKSANGDRSNEFKKEEGAPTDAPETKDKDDDVSISNQDDSVGLSVKGAAATDVAPKEKEGAKMDVEGDVDELEY